MVLLTLAYTVSRTECPCPKTYDGFNPSQHWRVRDFDAISILGLVCLLVRFQAIKQDPRIERPAGRGDGDWSIIGGIPGSKMDQHAEWDAWTETEYGWANVCQQGPGATLHVLDFFSGLHSSTGASWGG